MTSAASRDGCGLCYGRPCSSDHGLQVTKKKHERRNLWVGLTGLTGSTGLTGLTGLTGFVCFICVAFFLFHLFILFGAAWCWDGFDGRIPWGTFKQWIGRWIGLFNCEDKNRPADYLYILWGYLENMHSTLTIQNGKICWICCMLYLLGDLLGDFSISHSVNFCQHNSGVSLCHQKNKR